ncbi:capsular polysaccharide synthesis protein [Lactiplantibacillus plantarum]|uniref:capsular polysaccharide synthesis protein n=1 Tax=Lactiplantibacillus plantarum TaxID=1590 RepID=UPI0016514607|nr:capsular polysaccharide synthesis protein [Lactiplantibacillus plantarum]
MNKVFKIAKKFYTDIRYYSFQLACIHLGETFSRYTKFNLADKYYLKKDKIVLNYLRTRYTNSPKQDVYGGVPKIYQPIWVFWYQGEEQMPKLVSACLKSVRNNANGHEVILIWGKLQV